MGRECRAASRAPQRSVLPSLVGRRRTVTCRIPFAPLPPLPSGNRDGFPPCLGASFADYFGLVHFAVSAELRSPRRTDYYDLGRNYTAQAPNAASVRAPYAASMWSRPLPFPRFGFALPSPIVLSDRTVKPAGPPCDVQ
jgi:hypothetical protein